MANRNVRQSRRWRCVLRLSLRGLIILVLVIGACLGWIVRSARIQRNALSAIAGPPTHYVGATDVTDAGLADLESSLPGLQIDR